MTTYVMRNGKCVEKHRAEPLVRAGEAPNVISDIMSETRHMATGKFHTSKSAFRQDTKASGCLEVGNDPAISRPRKPVVMDRAQRRDDIRRSIYELRNGRHPSN